jgi:hypothetical protein
MALIPPGTTPFDTCQGTIKTPSTFESCTGFVNENLISIRIAQALAHSSTLISILRPVYEFFAKRELRKQARERAENGDDAQITLDIEAAPAQIALLQLEVGSQKKTIDVLHRTVDVMKKAAVPTDAPVMPQRDTSRSDYVRFLTVTTRRSSLRSLSLYILDIVFWILDKNIRVSSAAS